MNLFKKSKKATFLLIVILTTLAFFYPLFLKNKLPVPSDALVGLYHPFRDYLSQEYPRGVPYKNYLITDSVRQIIPWKNIALRALSEGEIPFWNPYSFGGTPLLGNLQSSPFYLFNFIIMFNQVTGWGIFIYLQVLLAAVFLFYFLDFQGLNPKACLFASLAWVFSGFFTAWMEWGNILHTGLWLPLILLAIDKAVSLSKQKVKSSFLRWLAVFIFAFVFSFLAGHLQTFFYVFVFSLLYLGYRLVNVKKSKGKLVLFFSFAFVAIGLLTVFQWLPFLKFLQVSARDLDVQQVLSRPDWFFPPQHLVNLFVPDFFGNPTTLNYWGVWNYGEFALYIGIAALFFAALALFRINKSKNILFYASLLFIFASLGLATPWAKLPYIFKLPLLSTAQPSRIVFLVDFCLVVLGAYGFDFFFQNLKEKQGFRKVFLTICFFSFVFLSLWGAVFIIPEFFPTLSWATNLAISKRNLIFPTIIYLLLVCGLFFTFLLSKKVKPEKLANLFFLFIFVLLAGDLFRFFHKFNPFTPKKWFYPQTGVIEFLQQDKTLFRITTTDRSIMPGNVSAYYGIQAVNGYDPLYLKNYAQYIAASERGKADISPPFGFNRIIEPQRIASPLLDLLNVKYVLSLEELFSDKLEKVFSEGETIIYKNNNFFPRAFLVTDLISASDQQETMALLFNPDVDLRKTAILDTKDFQEIDLNDNGKEFMGGVEFLDYQANKIILTAKTNKDALLVLNEVFYPNWQVTVDGSREKIVPVNFLFRGVKISPGEHQLVFTISF